MINWNEVDEIKSIWEKEESKLHPDLKTEFLGIYQYHLHIKQLLAFIDQFRPREFNPDDRGTWPEVEKLVILYPANEEREPILTTIYSVESTFFTARLGERVLYIPFSVVKSWLPLPPLTGKEETK